MTNEEWETDAGARPTSPVPVCPHSPHFTSVFPTSCPADFGLQLQMQRRKTYIGLISSHTVWIQIFIRNPLYIPPSDSISSKDWAIFYLLFTIFTFIFHPALFQVFINFNNHLSGQPSTNLFLHSLFTWTSELSF